MSFVRNLLAQPRTARRKAAVAGAAAVLGATGLALGVTPAMAAPASVATGAQGTARAMIGNEAQFQWLACQNVQAAHGLP